MHCDLNESLAALRTRATSRTIRKMDHPVNNLGVPKKISEYYGELTFDFRASPDITDAIKREIALVVDSSRSISREHAEVIAGAVTDWAIKNGATHFCHWFQPLTGVTAQKQDAFLDVKNKKPIDCLSVSELLQGESDASSFPNGGSRTTFEARGYTSWDLTSPMFLLESTNGRTLCIPAAFVSYKGDSLDIKTPLLKSLTKLSPVVTKFLNLAGHPESRSVHVNIGAEQEYFLIDKTFYYQRPDLVMTGRTLFGSLSTRNQQLQDHYYGTIPDRVLSFMQEFDYELHRLGIPSKTRHNEVAPGQYEMAPIFSDANVASDNNQLIMATLDRISQKHDFIALLHEKPFAGVNGSGKHINWSLSDDLGLNLLSPGNEPESNLLFLATIAIVVEAVYRHARAMRMSIASAGNDERLGSKEAPPSIISAYLGDAIDKIFHSIMEDIEPTAKKEKVIDLGTTQLANFLQDNTDRNRTSPFAFTGNKFEFRAVGSFQAIGFPVTILNAAVMDVFNDANKYLEELQDQGQSVDESLTNLIKMLVKSSRSIVFNGDGYSKNWLEEAQRRSLPNDCNTPESLMTMKDLKNYDFLIKGGIFTAEEINTRYNILLEQYIDIRKLEFDTLVDMVHQYVIPSGLAYKAMLLNLLREQKALGLSSEFEMITFQKISTSIDELHSLAGKLLSYIGVRNADAQECADKIATEGIGIAENIANICNELEELLPSDLYKLPKYYDMLFFK